MTCVDAVWFHLNFMISFNSALNSFVRSFGHVKCFNSIQFSAPAHLAGQLHFLSPPGQPTTTDSVWKRLADRAQTDLWCRHCLNFGHSPRGCPDKDKEDRCDTCAGYCKPFKCPTFASPKCQSSRCNESKPHRTSQCKSVMSQREDVRNQAFFLRNSIAYKTKCRFGMGQQQVSSLLSTAAASQQQQQQHQHQRPFSYD